MEIIILMVLCSFLLCQVIRELTQRKRSRELTMEPIHEYINERVERSSLLRDAVTFSDFTSSHICVVHSSKDTLIIH